jgi:hypothetical protein
MSPARVVVDGDLDDLIDPASEDFTDDTSADLDDLMYQQENEVLPLTMPPETEADFE